MNGGEPLEVCAPLAGWCDSLDDSPDPVFRDRVLGDGVSIDPLDGTVVAPFDGDVVLLPETRHAVNVRADNGVEVLIHVGIDTVALGGRAFTAFVRQGDRVARGQRLLEFDMDAVLRQVPSLRTPVLLVAADGLELRGARSPGLVSRGEPVFEVHAKRPSGSAASGVSSAGPGAERRVVVGLAHGVHARPAAAIKAAADAARSRLACILDDGRHASLSSAVAMMALGIRRGQAVTLVAEGPDADAALDAVEPLFEPDPAAAADARPGRDAGGPAVATANAAPVGAGSVIRAQPVNAGIAIGTAFVYGAWQMPPRGQALAPAVEWRRMEEALAAVRAFLTDLAARSQGAGREIATAHLALLDDPALVDGARELVDGGRDAARAWQAAVDEYAALLMKLDDRRLRERADDLADIGSRVQRALAGEAPGTPVRLPESAILLARNLLPSQLLELDESRLAGICTVAGGTTSHVAILADGMGVPMLVAADERILAVHDGARVVLDADAGELHVEPGDAAFSALRDRARDERARRATELANAKTPCTTADGVVVAFHANLASPGEAAAAMEAGADGCGLLRSEFLFMDRAAPPGIEEQRQAYARIADALGARPLTVRTLDAGGDKPVSYLAHEAEDNPALGVRGIRLSLQHRDLFRMQLEALCGLRTAGPLKVMLPMVTMLDEVLAARSMLEAACDAEGPPVAPSLGIMIETPAAALMAERLADHVDFFSIGTNDLTQYTLAMDRGEPRLAGSVDVLHPAVLRLIERTASAAIAAGKPVSVCGAAAGDILAAPLLIGFGIRELSMVPAQIARQKARVRELDTADCARLGREALAAGSAAEVRAMMREFIAGQPPRGKD